jgi:hypothetical protein
MNELIALLKSLKVPLLNPKEVAALEQLEQEWRHWEERENQIMPLRIEAEQKSAYAAFLDDPSEANEQRLAVLADPLLTGKRYALLRRAFGELRCRITAQAAVILKPMVTRVREALAAEHNRRLEKAEPVMAVKQAQAALDCINWISNSVSRAIAGKTDESPLKLAGGLVKE